MIKRPRGIIKLFLGAVAIVVVLVLAYIGLMTLDMILGFENPKEFHWMD